MTSFENIQITLSSESIASDPILESFVSYYKSLDLGNEAPAAQSAAFSTSRPKSSPRRGGSGVNANNSDEYIKGLVRLLANEVEHAHEKNIDSNVALTETLAQFRAEVDVTDVYKGRIVDLQKVINGTKLPGELDALIGRQELVVPIGADPSEDQKQREAVHNVSRLAGRVRDVNERLRAQNAMLSTQVGGLLAENALLMDRIALLEEQVSALGNSAATTMRALNKARLTPSSAAATSQIASNTTRQKVTDTTIAGVQMDRETALWLKDVYQRLSKGAAVDDAIKSAGNGDGSRRPQSSSSRQRSSSQQKGATPFSKFVEENRSTQASLNGM